MDGGSSFNIMYAHTLELMGIGLDKLRPSKSSFHSVTPGKRGQPLGQIDLPVCFGTAANFRKEVLTFDTLLLLSSCRREGVRSALPGLRGLLGVRLPVDVPVAPCFSFGELHSYFVLRFRCIRHFVINVINNIRIRFIISFYVICAMIYCSFCCIYV